MTDGGGLAEGDYVTVRDEDDEIYRIDATNGQVARLHDLDGNKYGLYSVEGLVRAERPVRGE